jgi:prophage antirepressor-like protein
MNKLAVFNNTTIRRKFHNDEWWFVVTDVVQALTDSANPTDYIKKLRSRDKDLSKGWGQFVTPPFNRNRGWAAKDKSL